MSMHLARGLTTTSTKKRTEKITKARQAELESGWRDRNVRLREMRLPKETFEQYMEWVYGKGKKTKGEKNSGKKITKATTHTVACTKETTDRKNTTTGLPGPVTEPIKAGVPGHGSIWVTGACSSKPSPTYTGTKVIGIATMHKSNAIPIFSDSEAKEVSSMRR
jgi:hypothetical protein